MMGISPRRTCRPLFKTLRMLTVPSQNILSVMKCLVNNLDYFLFNDVIPNLQEIECVVMCHKIDRWIDR